MATLDAVMRPYNKRGGTKYGMTQYPAAVSLTRLGALLLAYKLATLPRRRWKRMVMGRDHWYNVAPTPYRLLARPQDVTVALL